MKLPGETLLNEIGPWSYGLCGCVVDEILRDVRIEP